MYTLTQLEKILEANGEDASEWIDGAFDSAMQTLPLDDFLTIQRCQRILEQRRGVGESGAKDTVIKLGLLLSRLGAK